MQADLSGALNLLLRGGTVFALALVAASLWRARSGAPAVRLGAGFAVSLAAATLAGAPGLQALPFLLHAFLIVLASGAMLLFWLFTRALFDDSFVVRPWHAGAWLLLATLGLLSCTAQVAAVPRLAAGLSVILAAFPVVWALLAIVQSVASWRDDLVDARRRVRVALVAATALYTVAQLIAASVGAMDMRVLLASDANAFGVAVLTILFAWQLLGLRHGELFVAHRKPVDVSRAESSSEVSSEVSTEGSAEESAVTAVSGSTPSLEVRPAPDPLDPRQVATLTRLMSAEHVYREPAMSISVLAQRMGLPEHRVRRLINQGLGHRNFATYLNGFRIAEACRRLADPGEASVAILTIAMDAGFRSLGPFNRAFRLELGMTPSEYRRRRSDVEQARAQGETSGETSGEGAEKASSNATRVPGFESA